MSPSDSHSPNTSNNDMAARRPQHLSTNQVAILPFDIASEEGAPGGSRLLGVKLFLLNMSLLAVTFLHALDISIVANLQPHISSQLHYVEALPWLSIGFSMGALATAMPIGKLYAIGNTKAVFVFCMFNYIAGTALSGGTPTMTGEIVGRVWAGIGSNGMRLGLFLLAKDIMPDVKLHAYMYATNVSWAFAIILGPVVGIMGSTSWRWAFYVELIASIAILPVLVFQVPSERSRNQAEGSLDFAGTLFSSVPVVMLTVATNYAGIVNQWRGATVILLYAISGILIMSFLLQQSFCIYATATERHLAIGQLRNREPALRFLLVVCGSILAWIDIYYLPLYFQVAKEHSASDTAKDILPFVLPLVAAMVSADMVYPKPKYYRFLCILSAVVGLIGSVFMSRMDGGSAKSGLYACVILLGVCAGCFVHVGFAAYLPEAEAGDHRPSISLQMLGHLVGSWLGLSVAGAAFVGTARDGVRELFPELGADVRDRLLLGTTGEALAALGQADRALALACLVEGLKKAFTASYVVAAVLLALTMMVQWE